jgi:hypothetical protein
MASEGDDIQPIATFVRHQWRSWPGRHDRKKSSSHSLVLLQKRDHISDSPGIAFGGVQLVAELDKIALSLC